MFAIIFTLAAYTVFATARLVRYLHIFQQDDYNGTRFLSWMFRTWAFDKRVTLALLAPILALPALSAAMPNWGEVISICSIGLIFALFALLEPDPRKEAKKKLAMTSRAQRILWVAVVICALLGVGVVFLAPPWAWLFLVQAIPFVLIVSDFALKPVEKKIQQRYWDEAQVRLQQVRPKIIGITGSFGKTSVKHILGHVLDLTARALTTPGSVNTPMGIARIIRETLQPGCQYFVVEMGAYGLGSIARLCRLAPPDIAIITSIGEAHYERFTTLDTIVRAKFEIADSIMRSPGGRIVMHESVLDVPLAKQTVEKNRDRYIICGQREADLVIESSEFSEKGISLIVRWQGRSYRLEAPLFGYHHVGNLALAFAASLALQIPAERTIAALRTVPQIKHRLEVKPQPSGAIYIDDAYNSNPRGFSAALEVMSKLAKQGARRILVTPGMAELGTKHDAAHHEVGIKAAELTDLTIVVKGDRIPTFMEAFKNNGDGNKLLTVESFAEAERWLTKNVKPGDVVLIENDLPDLYERTLRL
jgi:UDP-N-acetylmuramoyl-tripeptide--D-alanyl-D-alanine ligase